MKKDDTPKEKLDDVEISQDNEDIIPDEETDTQESQVAKLRKRLKACEAEKQEYLDGWQRAKADMVNARRQSESESAHAYRRGVAAAVGKLMGALDAFEASRASEQWDSLEPKWKEGIENIGREFSRAFEELGIEIYGAAGDSFDPESHEAVSSMPTSDEAKDHTVAQVLQKGYREKEGNVLRPAKVVIFILES